MNQFENVCCEEALKKRNDSLYKLFEGNAEALSNLLEVTTPPTYTFHGEKHIKMVKQYVGCLLGEKRIAKLTDDELFILLMGVLCHDLGMSQYDWDNKGGFYVPDRENHNIASYLMVYDQPNYRKNENLSITVPSDDPKYFKAIAELCLGHRDHKDERNQKVHTLSDSVKIPGCDEVKIKSPLVMSDNRVVHVEYLTAILRLADEIDVTNQRAPQDVEKNLRSFITDETKKHWMDPNIISHVTIIQKTEPDITSIVLVPGRDYIKAKSKDPINGVSLDQLLSLLFERLEKIREEIDIVNDITASFDYHHTGLSVKFEVDIDYDDSFVTEEKYAEYKLRVDDERGKSNLEKTSGMDLGGYRGRKIEETPTERFNNKIQRLKEDKGLLECSNFEFPFGEYSHYFINTQLLLTDGTILDDITELFLNLFGDKNIDCVVGVGKAGIILAPNLSLKLNCNSSYMICGWENPSSTKWEKSTSVIETAKNVLLILDVLSTGTVTEQSLDEIKSRNKTNLENVYIGAVFCTNKAVKNKLKAKVKDVHSIYDDFQFRTYKPKKDKDKNDHDDKEYIITEEMKNEFGLLPPRRK